ncbi:uncharacterized protein LOC114714109 [Neltuma alba]|uniref:uncharacterized protein LOC114714109 n=1 Tax=Neltuma alba TaxID=207710 RepID=UPI0010A5123B|nr:uncharacterized protein LOC114714109 [Prosopis alba]
MDRNLRVGHRSSYFSGGGCMMSPSCIPVAHDDFNYSRIPQNGSAAKRSRGWRNLLRKFMRESNKNFHGSKPPSFQYDPVSYSQNFRRWLSSRRSTQTPLLHLSRLWVNRDVALNGLDCRCQV